MNRATVPSNQSSVQGSQELAEGAVNLHFNTFCPLLPPFPKETFSEKVELENKIKKRDSQETGVLFGYDRSENFP